MISVFRFIYTLISWSHTHTMQNPPRDGPRATEMVGAAATSSSSADERGKQTVDALWQRGVNFVSNISPIIAIGASGALAGMCAMSLWNKVNETLRPSAERLASGDKGISARQPFVGDLLCIFCGLSFTVFSSFSFPTSRVFTRLCSHRAKSNK